MKQKVKLKLDWCTYKAAKYACENWHYSKCIPKSKLVKIGVWEDDIFKGVIIYSYGATQHLVKPYGLKMNEGCELTRIALKEHKTTISRIMSISFKFLKKHCPKLQLIVSFADPNEGHHGGIYQATNWIYTGITKGCYFFKDKKGKIWHPRNVSENLNLSSKCIKPSQCKKIWKEGKHRYLMPLNKIIMNKIEKLKIKYPKRTSSNGKTSNIQLENGGSIPTCTLQK